MVHGARLTREMTLQFPRQVSAGVTARRRTLSVLYRRKLRSRPENFGFCRRTVAVHLAASGLGAGGLVGVRGLRLTLRVTGGQAGLGLLTSNMHTPGLLTASSLSPC